MMYMKLCIAIAIEWLKICFCMILNLKTNQAFIDKDSTALLFKFWTFIYVYEAVNLQNGDAHLKKQTTIIKCKGLN